MENTEAAVKVATSIWDQVTGAPAHLLLVLILNVLGIVLKSSPISNRLIVPAILSIGGIAYPFLVSPGNVDPSFKHPALVLSIYGILLGAGSIIIHKIGQRFEKFRQFEDAITNGFRRDDQQPKENKPDEK